MKSLANTQLTRLLFLPLAFWLTISTPVALAIIGFPGSGTSEAATAAIGEDYPNAHLLIDAEELNRLITDGENDFILVDMRQSGFEDGHIRGAVHLAGPGALADPDHEIEHYLVSADQFAAIMGRLGIDRESNLIIYDEGVGLGSARLFYALERFGHQGSIRLLNGGILAWKDVDYPLETGEVREISPATYETAPADDLVCDVAYIRDRMGSDDFVLFDARSRGEYEGRNERAARSGHIPGAVHIEWNRAIADAGVPFFRPKQDLENLLADYGITPDKEVVPYCQSNVRGSHVYFTLRLMGYDTVRPYEGSWSEYGNREDVPIE